MKIGEKYNRLLDKMTPSLEENGFLRSRHTFYLQSEGNWGLINFQKSTKSTAESIFFTINLGIASTRLLEHDSLIHKGRKPGIWDCHWQKRLGHCFEKPTDQWWLVEYETLIDELVLELTGYVIDLGIPAILKNISDVSLRDLWLSGAAPSLTNIQRLHYLSVLIREIGPLDLLDSIDAELQKATR